MKLYKVTLQGMTGSYPISWGESYVVADNPNEAYEKVRTFLNSNDIGFTKDRELRAIEMIADSERYASHPIRLYI